MSLEFANQQNELALPVNIHDLLKHSLEPAAALNAAHAATEKYFVADRPDLFVRLNRGEPIESIRAALSATANLQNYGINILPFALIEHDDQGFVITQRVNGHTLSDIISPDTGVQLKNQLEDTWEGLGKSIYDSMTHDGPLIYDIDEPHQYMLGTTATDPQPKIWLTDLPNASYKPMHEDEYAHMAVYLATGIIAVENLIDQRLPRSRAIAEKIITTRSHEEAETRAKLRMARYVLAHNVILSPWEDDEVERFWDDP